ncbi:hypothetical protein [Bacillus atrophaeus]|uniref:hypothetical protein n=1 Tax=Bacillus atrophaeus TaxID=1452 RepID=UPI002281F245|nr:hypothetical protein [Bacillus atrophaeus]MCY8466450.1 hypothetical protein [Bacillus atrophaeus]MCY8478909.1 hypothetical protein [Bacillus atrophaeus]
MPRLYLGFSLLNWNIGFEAILLKEGKLFRISFLPLTLIVKLGTPQNKTPDQIKHRVKMKPIHINIFGIFKGILLYCLFFIVIGLVWRQYEIVSFGFPQPSAFDNIICSILSISLMFNVVHCSIIKDGKF